MNNADSRPSQTLDTLGTGGEFIARHIGPRDKDIAAMLETVGASSLEALVESTVPPGILDRTALDLPAAAGEDEALADRIGAALGPGYAVEHWREIDPGLVAMIDFLIERL